MTQHGRVSQPRRLVMKAPTKGKRVFLLTSAQNNTSIHAGLWCNLLALAKHDRADILVSSFTYNKVRNSKGQKKTAAEGWEDSEWWAEEVRPYLADTSIQLASSLVWCGELQMLPTAVDPISGLESYTGRDSAVIPHPKVALRSIASAKNKGTKFVYTTGACTLRNYLQKKAGQKAEFHHSYGALIVEVDTSGAWYARQLCADNEGNFYDLDRKIEGGMVTTGHRPAALVWGDIHARQMDGVDEDRLWGRAGIRDQLRPHVQVLHDLVDFRAANHHDRNDPWLEFAKEDTGQRDVAVEVKDAARLLARIHVPGTQTLVVTSNHDEAMVRWLKETDHRDDPHNAMFYLTCNLAAYSAIHNGNDDWYAVEWALRAHLGHAPSSRTEGIRFLRRDQETLIQDVRVDQHGDVGLNGARGTLKGYARTGRKSIIGHSHSAGIHEGVWQVGVMAKLDQGYNQGDSSWSHTFALIHDNGKRQLITLWKGKYRA